MSLKSDWLPFKMKFIFISNLLAGSIYKWIKYYKWIHFFLNWSFIVLFSFLNINPKFQNMTLVRTDISQCTFSITWPFWHMMQDLFHHSRIIEPHTKSKTKINQHNYFQTVASVVFDHVLHDLSWRQNWRGPAIPDLLWSFSWVEPIFSRVLVFGGMACAAPGVRPSRSYL